MPATTSWADRAAASVRPSACKRLKTPQKPGGCLTPFGALPGTSTNVLASPMAVSRPGSAACTPMSLVKTAVDEVQGMLTSPDAAWGGAPRVRGAGSGTPGVTPAKLGVTPGKRARTPDPAREPSRMMTMAPDDGTAAAAAADEAAAVAVAQRQMALVDERFNRRRALLPLVTTTQRWSASPPVLERCACDTIAALCRGTQAAVDAREARRAAALARI